MKKHLQIILSISFLIFGLSACGGGSEGNSPDLIDVVISSNALNPIIGKDFILKANAVYSDRTSQDITSIVEWRLSDETLASIDSTGKFTPIKEGEITVIARYGQISGEKTYSIGDIPRINSITASGIPDSFTEGNERQLKIKIINTDKTEFTDTFEAVTFTSSNEEVISVNTAGLVKALSYGSAEITVTSKNSDANVIIPVSISPSVKNLKINRDRFYLDIDSSEQSIEVTATLTDDTELDYTSRVSWRYSTTNEEGSFSATSNFFSVASSGKLSPQIEGTFYIKPVFDNILGEQTAAIIVEDPISLAALIDTQKEIVVTWNAKQDATEYKLYWNTVGNISPDSEEVTVETITSATEFSLPDVDITKTYYFRIAFLRENSTELSPLSNELAIKPLKRQWQHKPVLPTLRQGAATILLNDTLLIFGGMRTNDAGELTYSNLVSEFNFETNKNKGTEITNRRDMPSPKAGMAACLHNNNIYLFGGTNQDDTLSNTILKYEPLVDAWTTAGISALPVSLSYLSCNTVADKIYLIGGADSTGASLKTYIFDPLNESSEIKEGPSLHYPRYKHASVVSDNKIFVAGGINSEGTEATFESINPEIETEWTLLPRLETARYGFGLASYGKKIFAFGGTNTQGIKFQSVESFDYTVPNVLWQPEVSMPFPYTEFSLITKDSTIYFYGGNYDTNTLDSFKQVVHFDASLNIWFPNTSPELTVTDFGSAILNNHLFIAGGRQGVSAKNELQSYDLTNNTWGGSNDTSRRPNSLEEARFRAATLSFKGSVFVIGGYKSINNTPLRSVEQFENSTNTWQSAGDLNQPRADACAVEYRNQLYVFGGSTIEAKDNIAVTVPVNSYEIFEPTSKLWINRGPISTTPRIGATCVVLNDRIYLIGGLVEVSNDKLESTNSVDVYNPQSSKFETSPANMNIARVNPAAVIFNGSIYLFGGFTSDFDKRTSISSAEKFLPYNKTLSHKGKGNEWIDLPSMDLGFHHLNAHVINNKILLIGSRYDDSTAESAIQNHITIFE